MVSATYQYGIRAGIVYRRSKAWDAPREWLMLGHYAEISPEVFKRVIGNLTVLTEDQTRGGGNNGYETNL